MTEACSGTACRDLLVTDFCTYVFSQALEPAMAGLAVYNVGSTVQAAFAFPDVADLHKARHAQISLTASCKWSQ